jgi:transposase InsO family protein
VTDYREGGGLRESIEVRPARRDRQGFSGARVHHSLYRERAEATTDLFYYIEGWYNRWRLHSSLAYESPAVFEQLYHQRQEIGLTPCPQK